VAQIVATPKVSDAKKKKIDRLNGFKKRIQEGSSLRQSCFVFSRSSSKIEWSFIKYE
jgi:peptidyl-prolyl cis-trans isomerase SurA